MSQLLYVLLLPVLFLTFYIYVLCLRIFESLTNKNAFLLSLSNFARIRKIISLSALNKFYLQILDNHEQPINMNGLQGCIQTENGNVQMLRAPKNMSPKNEDNKKIVVF